MDEKKKKIDMEDVADKLLKAGHRVQAIEWTGDPKKKKEIFLRMGEAVLEIARTTADPVERKRLLDERTEEAIRELDEAGIKGIVTPLYGEWPHPPVSEN